MAKRWSAARLGTAATLLAVAISVAAIPRARAASCMANGKVAVLVEGTSTDAAAAAVNAVGGKVESRLDLVKSVAATVHKNDMPGLAGQPGVRYVAPTSDVRFQADAAPPRQATAVYPAVIGAPATWAKGADGTGVGVAVIDTGISPVPDLAGRLIGGVDLSGGNDPFNDEYGPGTFVAGIIAGNGAGSQRAYTGVAPDANLISVKIAGADGAADITQVLAALQWTVSFRDTFGIRVVNLSLGTDSTQLYQHSLLNYAVERAWDAGIVVVVSSSNLGPNPGTVTKPGDDPLVVTAGAIDDHGTAERPDDTIPGFSGVGPTADGFTKPDLVAPGRSLVSLRAPGSTIDAQFPDSRVGAAYFKGSGTSFAAAATSGAAALLLDGNRSLTPDKVKSRLLATAAPAPPADTNVVARGSLAVAAAASFVGSETRQALVPRSLGDGTLDRDRGHLIVSLNGHNGPSLDACATPGSNNAKVIGSLSAQGRDFDRAAFVGTWSGSSWYGSSWYGSSWYGSSWYGSSWYGSSWYGSSWYGS